MIKIKRKLFGGEILTIIWSVLILNQTLYVLLLATQLSNCQQDCIVLNYIVKLLHSLSRWREWHLKFQTLSCDQTRQMNPRTVPLSLLFNISLRIWTCNSSTTAHTQTHKQRRVQLSVTELDLISCVCVWYTLNPFLQPVTTSLIRPPSQSLVSRLFMCISLIFTLREKRENYSFTWDVRSYILFTVTFHLVHV